MDEGLFGIIARIWSRLVQKIIFQLKKCKYTFLCSKYIDLLEICNIKSNRLPNEILKNCSNGIRINSNYFAGERVRFTTKSEKLEFIVVYKTRSVLKHMSSIATSGIDVYQQNNSGYSWVKCIGPNISNSMEVKDSIKLPPGEKNIVIYLPGYASIYKILVNKDSFYSRYEFQENKSMAIYGSSITQGCAASRPGLSYANILSRNCGYRVYNFGFSQSAYGEVELIEYIASLGTDIVVIEYDHNATIEELNKTHRNVYVTIRERNKNCMLIFMSRFSGGLSISQIEEIERISIISKTVENAIHNGDNNVRFLDGSKVFVANKDDYFSDDRHPNDLGMNRIAYEIHRILTKKRS